MKKINLLLSVILLSTGIGFGQSITLSPTGANGRQGIGIETPGTTLEVASQTSGSGINISGLGNGFKSGRLSFWSDRLAANEWRPGFIQSANNGIFTGRLDFYTNGTGIGSNVGAVRIMSVTNAGVGVGTTTPFQKLHVKDGNMLVEDTTPFLEFRNTGDAGANGIRFATSTGSTRGRIMYTPTSVSSGVINITEGTNSTEGIFVTDGKVGLNEDDPSATFHISANSQPATPHLRFFENNNGLADNITFENNAVTAKWHIKAQANNTADNANFVINATNSGDVLSLKGNGNIGHLGYTNLGDNAPKIKMKKLTGTTALTEGASVNIPHGLGATKILAVDIHINYSTTAYVGNSHLRFAGYQSDYIHDSTNIRVYNVAGNSVNILGKPVTILITYEE